MPTRPRLPCRSPTCPKLQPCSDHPLPVPFARARRSSSLYQTPRWRQARRAFLAINPTCHECTRQGAITPATFVDHRRPHGGNDAMFWDQSNWQPLCRRCSNMKTGQDIQAREKSRTRRGEEAMANTTQPKPMFTIPVTVVCGPPGAGKRVRRPLSIWRLERSARPRLARLAAASTPQSSREYGSTRRRSAPPSSGRRNGKHVARPRPVLASGVLAQTGSALSLATLTRPAPARPVEVRS